MDHKEYSVNNNIMKKHFSKLHERVQYKYEEMQKKMARTKSLDILNECNDDDVFHQRVMYPKETSSSVEINEIRYRYDSTVEENKEHQIVIEDVDKDFAGMFDLLPDASGSSHSISVPDLRDTGSVQSSERNHSTDNISVTSSESLNSVSLENDVFITQSDASLHPHRTLRMKLRDHILKRKRHKQEKKLIKEKHKTDREDLEKLVLSNTTKQDIRKVRTKLATVSVALIEATDVTSDGTEERVRLYQCRFKLGTEKSKTKLSKCSENKVQWQELFSFSLFDDDHSLDISLWEKDNVLGKSTINLFELDKEKTHKLYIDLESDSTNITLFILLTISGTIFTNMIADLGDYKHSQDMFDVISKNYAWYRIPSKDVGYLSVIVYGAKGLSSNDCFCLLELDNDRLFTHTEYKTQCPNWMKAFNFSVKDIASLLEVTVVDERRSEDVGKVTISLLKIKNSEKKWYALKDTRQRERAKGNNPRILLEVRVTWNLFKASQKVITPKEVKYLSSEQKFDRQLFARNVSRTKAVSKWILDFIKVLK